ncbi:MAG: RsmD family RNA methyltransferase [Monoglobaceae bacterium]
MRVISGIRKGLKLKAPDGMNTRPTTDRVKESVFNIIQTHIPSDNVLDLFSGSGALGIEALSRRCGKCTFVEYNKQAFELVRHNVELSKLSDNA